jgi:hypothetical protein
VVEGLCYGGLRDDGRVDFATHGSPIFEGNSIKTKQTIVSTSYGRKRTSHGFVLGGQPTFGMPPHQAKSYILFLFGLHAVSRSVDFVTHVSPLFTGDSTQTGKTVVSVIYGRKSIDEDFVLGGREDAGTVNGLHKLDSAGTTWQAMHTRAIGHRRTDPHRVDSGTKAGGARIDRLNQFGT